MRAENVTFAACLIVNFIADVHAYHKRIATVALGNISQTCDPVSCWEAGHVPKPLIVDCCVAADPSSLGYVIIHNNHKTVCGEAMNNTVQQVQSCNIFQTRTLVRIYSSDVLESNPRIIACQFDWEWDSDTVRTHANDLMWNITYGLAIQTPDAKQLLVCPIPIYALETHSLPCCCID